jgi:hypothetical protein
MEQLAIERFWKKVDKRSTDECWPWLGGKTTKGYGRARFAGTNARRAHRVAYLLTYGELPDSKLVMHSCDNPSCCNPAHLSLGDAWDNVWDMDRKGRRRGLKNPLTMNKNGQTRKNTARPEITIRLPAPLLEKLRAYSSSTGESMSRIIRVLLEAELQDN